MHFWIYREECKVTELQATVVTELQTTVPTWNEFLFNINKTQMFNNLYLFNIKAGLTTVNILLDHNYNNSALLFELNELDVMCVLLL